jgi:hypothetical protein
MHNSDIKHREAWICETFWGYEIKFEPFSQSFKSTEYTGRIVYKTLQPKILLLQRDLQTNVINSLRKCGL